MTRQGFIIAVVLALLGLRACIPARAQVMLPHRHGGASQGSGPPPFDSNLIVWLDASTMAPFATNGVASRGWYDQTIYHNDFTNTVTTNAPIWRSNQVNGHAAMAFSCTNTTGMLPNVPPATSSGWWNAYSGYTDFYVIKNLPSPCVAGGGILTGQGVDGFSGYSGGDYAAGIIYPEPPEQVSGGVISSSFFTTQSKNADYATVDVNQWCIMNNRSTSGSYTFLHDGRVIITTTNNTFGTPLNSDYATLGYANSFSGGSVKFPYTGLIAEFLLYKVALSDADCLTVQDYLRNKYAITFPSNPDTISAHWAFNEGSGTTFADSVSADNGTLFNAPTWVTGHNGTGSAIQFIPASNQYGTAPDISTIRFNQNFTVALWLKSADTNQANHYLLTRTINDGSVETALIYGYTSKQVEFFSSNYTGTNPRTGSQIQIDNLNWHFVAYTYDGTTWAGYKDGTNVFSTARSFNLGYFVGTVWYFGCSPHLSGPPQDKYSGAMDDVRFYRRALTSGEIATLYTQ